jgi:hypothetical protein
MSASQTRVLEFTDRFAKVDGPRPLELRRAVRRAEATTDLTVVTPVGELQFTLDDSSELVDETIVFEWEEAEEAYHVDLEDGRTPPEVEFVAVNADLAELLPEGAVEPGARWTVSPEAFRAVLSPGGDWSVFARSVPALQGEELEAADLIGATYLRAMQPWDQLDGDVTATYVATVEVDGVPHAQLSLAYELELSRDLGQPLQRAFEAAALELDREGYEAEVEWQAAGKGTVLWNLEHRRLGRADLQLAGPATIQLSWTQASGQGELEIEVEAEVELDSALEYAARSPE